MRRDAAAECFDELRPLPPRGALSVNTADPKIVELLRGSYFSPTHNHRLDNSVGAQTRNFTRCQTKLPKYLVCVFTIPWRLQSQSGAAVVIAKSRNR